MSSSADAGPLRHPNPHTTKETTIRTTFHPTSIELSTERRRVLAISVERQMATALELFTQVKQAHWNVRGPNFAAHHELFDTMAKRLVGLADRLAERIAALGFYVRGTARMVADTSMLAPYPESAITGGDHLRALVDRYAMFAAQLRSAIDEASSLADPATEDLFTQVLVDVEHDLWLLESHLPPDRARARLEAANTPPPTVEVGQAVAVHAQAVAEGK